MELNPAELRAFAFEGHVQLVERQPGGHINRSYRVETAGPNGPRGYLVQQLNAHVFRNPAAVMSNIEAVTGHIAAIDSEQVEALPAQQQLVLVPTRSGGHWLEAADGTTWRAFPFLAGAIARTRVERPSQAETAGLAFGSFLRLMSSYSGPPLIETIPHFHDTAWHLEALESAAREDTQQRIAGARNELRACLARQSLASELRKARSSDTKQRIVHNDAKLGNVLLDIRHERPLAVIDLDTVMHGSALSDAGDLLRTVASPTDEDEPDLVRVRAEPALVEAVLKGWSGGAGDSLTRAEQQLAVLAGCVITLEQAARFLTDYLVGDTYYGCTDPEQNLRRTRAQLALLDSMVSQRASFERMADRLASSTT